MALVNGQKLGPYLIESPIGAGGMGEVYKARDSRLFVIIYHCRHSLRHLRH